MRELERLLPELDPPPGGLARLQRSLRARRHVVRARGWRWLPAGAGAGVLALLALAWLPGLVDQQRQADALKRALLQATMPPPLTNGIRVDDGAALLLPSSQPGVRVYLVQTSPPGATTSRTRPAQGSGGSL